MDQATRNSEQAEYDSAWKSDEDLAAESQPSTEAKKVKDTFQGEQQDREKQYSDAWGETDGGPGEGGASEGAVSATLQQAASTVKGRADGDAGLTKVAEPSKEVGAQAKPVANPAATFKEAFASARKGGAKTFEWNGKKYTTDLKAPAKPAIKPAIKPAVKPVEQPAVEAKPPATAPTDFTKVDPKKPLGSAHSFMGKMSTKG